LNSNNLNDLDLIRKENKIIDYLKYVVDYVNANPSLIPDVKKNNINRTVYQLQRTQYHPRASKNTLPPSRALNMAIQGMALQPQVAYPKSPFGMTGMSGMMPQMPGFPMGGFAGVGAMMGGAVYPVDVRSYSHEVLTNLVASAVAELQAAGFNLSSTDKQRLEEVWELYNKYHVDLLKFLDLKDVLVQAGRNLQILGVNSSQDITLEKMGNMDNNIEEVKRLYKYLQEQTFAVGGRINQVSVLVKTSETEILNKVKELLSKLDGNNSFMK
jgi:hypothetical protein